MRFFFAIALPDSVKSELAKLPMMLDHFRWVPVVNLHLTLQFIGKLDQAHLDAVQQAATRVEITEFSLKLQQAGAFPSSSRTSVLWVGVAVNGGLVTLHRSLYESLSSLDLGLEERTFVPHITVGRTKRGVKIDARNWIADHISFESEPFLVSAFHLFSSELRPSGAIYRRVASYPLVD
ncbi:MAG: RNA 2',3'-cyclic phosphodiesterase [Rhodothermia bacterium]|nr:MAG: RNA 2',3'-cyclic phosphodiesterase [Rhodothermia bacterium]